MQTCCQIYLAIIAVLIRGDEQITKLRRATWGLMRCFLGERAVFGEATSIRNSQQLDQKPRVHAGLQLDKSIVSGIYCTGSLSTLLWIVVDQKCVTPDDSNPQKRSESDGVPAEFLSKVSYLASII